MTEFTLRLDGGAAPAADHNPTWPVADPEVLRVRAVHRAAAELRRAAPVLLDGTTVLLAAETAGVQGLRDYSALSTSPGVLLLAPARAAAVLRRPVVQDVPAIPLTLGTRLLSPDVLRGASDPTTEQLLPENPAVAGELPQGAAVAMALAKIGRLLPAVLAAPATTDAVDRAQHLAILSVSSADIVAYPGVLAAGLVRVVEASVPLDGAPDARLVAFRAPDSAIEHFAIVIGDPAGRTDPPPLVRVHSECFTGDLLGSLRCDCGPQLRGAILRMAADGAGIILYLAQEGRGIGLLNKLRAYSLQDRGMDTLDANRALGWGADERNFLVSATMLDQLGVSRVRLLTNNPDKVAALAACGIEVVGRVPLVVEPNGVNDTYLATKAARFGHYLG